MTKLRIFFILVLAAALAVTWSMPVQAHAMLMRSIPAANAMLSKFPPRVELFFSEAVAGPLSQIQVLDVQGVRVDKGDVHTDPADNTHLLVSLPGLLPGVYIVEWKVISATDGHQTTGSFPFAYGNVPVEAMSATTAAMSAGQAPLPIAGMIVKGFLYLAASTLLGSILFFFLAWIPSIRKAGLPEEDAKVYEAFTKKLALIGIVTLVVANLLSLMFQAGLARGALAAWPWQAEFRAMVAGTRLGTLGILRFEAAGVLAILLLPKRNFWNRWMALAVCLGLLLTFSLESHAAGQARPLVPVLADWIHLTAVSVWVGGLFAFLGGMYLTRKLEPERRTVLTSILIPHFTTLAMVSVGALVLTGLYSAFLDVGRVNALLTTLYGQLLIVKLVIAGPMLAFGAFHFLITTPAMRRAASKPGGSPAWVNRFRTMLTSESILGVAILLWVGAFTSLPPASMTAIQMGQSQRTKADDLSIVLWVDPAQPGMNTFTVTITSGGKPVTNAQKVSLEFTSMSGKVPPAKADMTDMGKGRFSLQGGYLAMADQWDVKVVVLRPGKFDAYGDFKIDLSQAGGQAMP